MDSENINGRQCLPNAVKSVSKYAHRYAYINAYSKKKYHENEEWRLAKIEKVKQNYHKKKALKLQMASCPPVDI